MIIMLSDELCDFLGIDRGSIKIRKEVHLYINKYIYENSLQDSDDKRIIHPDTGLIHLWRLKDLDLIKPITYFDYYKYMERHYIYLDT